MECLSGDPDDGCEIGLVRIHEFSYELSLAYSTNTIYDERRFATVVSFDEIVNVSQISFSSGEAWISTVFEFQRDMKII